MEQTECVSFDDDLGEETLDDDVEMPDANLMEDGILPVTQADSLAGNASGIGGGCSDGSGGFEETCSNGGCGDTRDNAMGGPRRKRNKKKRRKSSSNTNITDINSSKIMLFRVDSLSASWHCALQFLQLALVFHLWYLSEQGQMVYPEMRFVINTCKQLKEKKSYLVWNAVGCLGVSAMMDLVKEVETIQHCGGQKTADGKRFRAGGGVLWNILKNREPKAYKEIMAKGKEFEKQFRQPQSRQSSGKKVVVTQVQNVPHGASECLVSDSSESFPSLQQNQEASESHKRRSSVRDRIRVPVTYDDLLEEGEIYEP